MISKPLDAVAQGSVKEFGISVDSIRGSPGIIACGSCTYGSSCPVEPSNGLNEVLKGLDGVTGIPDWGLRGRFKLDRSLTLA